MKRYIVIFFASFLIFFAILAGVYNFYKSNMTDEHFEKTIEENPELRPEDPEEEVIVNTLIMGIDEARSDTMILASYNKENQRITLLSIPRDTRVEIPGYGYDKINSAVARKEGTALAMETVGNLLGIDVHHYVKVDFKGAERIIDILGGVEINVPMNMDYEDPAQNLSIHIKKGKQVLNGKEAVKFARYRSGYPDQDLGRIRAQQELIKALIAKMTSPKVIPKALNIADAISKCVKTNLQASDIAHYAVKLKDIKMENIKFYTLPGEGGTRNKISYFLYDEEKLKEMMKQINIDLGVAAPEEETVPESTEAVAVSKEEIKIQVLNGAGISGIAAKVREELKEKGYSNIDIGNADRKDYEKSIIIDRNGNKEKLEMVSRDLNISSVESDIDNDYGYDITVIIGKDRINGGI